LRGKSITLKLRDQRKNERRKKMKKLFALVLSVTLLATMAGVGLASAAPSVEPAEVNLVLPDGEMASIEKTIDTELVDMGDVDIWCEIEKSDTDLRVRFAGFVGQEDSGALIDIVDFGTIDTDSTSILEVTELLNIKGSSPADVGDILYATVTFYYTIDTEDFEIATEEVSVSRGDLDLKPGSYPNSINCKKNGKTPVAILGSDNVDVTEIDVATILIGSVGELRTAIEDVNCDGEDDLVCHFKTKDLVDAGVFNCDPGTLTLTYELEGSDVVVSISDTVRTLHCDCIA
jgi:hypothetical protein